MPRIEYVRRSFSAGSTALIDVANSIIYEYSDLGFDLTLRQLYYQMVARDIIANKQTEYKRLGSIINDARLAGLIDWNSINDLTRELRGLSHWDSPSQIIETCAKQFRIDKWADQPYRIEVWVEKDALRNVVERICTQLDVPYFSCRGYVSQSEMWGAAQRLMRWEQNGQKTTILHLGDHDPSGIDMTRDIEERLELFGSRVFMERLALNQDQIDEYNPPPNPAKVTDSRYEQYRLRYGEESWELDALDPTTLANLISDAVERCRDEDLWDEQVFQENIHRRLLAKASKEWEEVAQSLKKPKQEEDEE